MYPYFLKHSLETPFCHGEVKLHCPILIGPLFTYKMNVYGSEWLVECMNEWLKYLKLNDF